MKDRTKYTVTESDIARWVKSYSEQDCIITAKLLEPKDSDNSLKNLYNRFIRNSDNSNFSDLEPLRLV